MKQKFALLLLLAFIVTAVSAQKAKKYAFVPGAKKPGLVGFAFTLTDFNMPNNWGSNGNATSLPVKEMSAGVSLFYVKGITPFVDFTARLNGIFNDYSALYQGKTGQTEIGLEFEPTLSIRPLKDENKWAPYLVSGLGIGLYTNRIGAYLPIGAGVQFNASNTTYLFLQGQYKAPLTPKVCPKNMYFSIGVAQNISTD